jgi:hypothetical protein
LLNSASVPALAPDELEPPEAELGLEDEPDELPPAAELGLDELPEDELPPAAELGLEELPPEDDELPPVALGLDDELPPEDDAPPDDPLLPCAIGDDLLSALLFFAASSA